MSTTGLNSRVQIGSQFLVVILQVKITVRLLSFLLDLLLLKRACANLHSHEIGERGEM